MGPTIHKHLLRLHEAEFIHEVPIWTADWRTGSVRGMPKKCQAHARQLSSATSMVPRSSILSSSRTVQPQCLTTPKYVDATGAIYTMSAHHLTIAKASFAAGLLRPDITKVGRDHLAAFHTLLEAAVTTCTSRNIQKCTEWIVANIAPSAARTAALGKYLSSFTKHTQQESRNDPNGKSTIASRKRLHILYVLHDVAHHTKHHTPNLSIFSTFTASLQPFLVELAQSTASEQRARILYRIHNLFELWDAERYWSKDFVEKLRRAITELGTFAEVTGANDTLRQPSQSARSEATFMMPATHGDPSTPYYDLPAGNLLPFLEPGSSAPIRPEKIRPLQFTTGPADKPLVNALKDFLKDVECVKHEYSIPDEGVGISEIDELGQITIRDEAGDVIGDTYYGWSRAFCEKMKRRRKSLYGDHDRRRSLSRASSRSSRRSPRKRRRYSDSDRSGTSSQSMSPPRFRAALPANVSNEQSRRQPPQAPRSFASGPQAGPPPPPPPASISNLPSNPALFHAPPLGPDGLPIPPPRPPNWNGPWPPPPPPPGAVQFHRSNSFQPPPPPPGYPGAYASNRR